MLIRPVVMVAMSVALGLAYGCATTETAEPSGGEPTADTVSGSDGGATMDVIERVGGDTTADAGALDLVTYHGTIRRIMAASCETCHVAGGSGPFPLTYAESEWANGAPWWATTAVSAVVEGQMPPWQPAPGCRSMAHARLLGDDEIAAFAAWQAEGFLAGEPASYVPPDTIQGVDRGEPDLRLDAGAAYTANLGAPDDYRCFFVGDAFEEDLFITATHIEPGVTAIVHHVLLYAIPPGSLAALEAKDADSAEPGYTCFGGPGGGASQTVAGWVPGSVPFATPDGSALRIEAGNRIVMQVHYNTAYLDASATVLPDQTEALFWTLPDGEVPEKVVRILPFAHTGISIPAGEPHVVEQTDFSIPFSATLIGVAPHMHTLGTSIRSEFFGDEGESACIVDVPEWDFNWQQFYLFTEDSFMQLVAGDTHRLTCTYDNSPENQAIVNGEQLSPKLVTWGDSTFDEMCLSYLIVMSPFEVDGGLCTGVAACTAECTAGDFDCFVGCTLVPGAACLQCLGMSFVECGLVECPETTTAAVACFQTMCEDDPLFCLTGTCGAEFDALHACLHEPLHQGACNDDFADCDLTY